MAIRESFGAIEVGEETPRELTSRSRGKVAVSHQLMTWRPPCRYSVYMPENFTLQLDVFRGPDGVRRFLPPDGDWRSFVVKCFVAGLAIRTEVSNLRPEYRTQVRVHFYAYHWMKARQEYLRRRFSHSRDVFIQESSRPESDATTVLHPLLELHPAFRSIGKIRSENGNQKQAFRIEFFESLYRIAQDLPQLEISELQFEQIIRNAFLDNRHPLPKSDPEILEEVYERFFRLIDSQDCLDSEEFSSFLISSSSSVPTRISRQLKEPKLDNRQAKSALFDLGWLGFRELAICIHSTCRTIANSIGDLSEAETRIFQSLYAQQPRLGNFTILQLMDRHEFLAPTLVDAWEGRQFSDVVVPLKNLLYFYTEMVQARRLADKIGSDRRLARTTEGNIASNISLDNAPQKSIPEKKLGHELAVALDVSCPKCEGTELWVLDFSNDGSDVIIRFNCETCLNGNDIIRRFNNEQLKKMVDEYFSPED